LPPSERLLIAHAKGGGDAVREHVLTVLFVDEIQQIDFDNGLIINGEL
jgi:hypothetical protein